MARCRWAKPCLCANRAGWSVYLESAVFLAVLAAAVMHAGWNVLVKLKLDRFLSLCLIQTLMGVMGLAMLLVFPLRPLASLPYAVASGVLHLGYNLFLARSYRTGDLSQVYPDCPRRGPPAHPRRHLDLHARGPDADGRGGRRDPGGRHLDDQPARPPRPAARRADPVLRHRHLGVHRRLYDRRWHGRARLGPALVLCRHGVRLRRALPRRDGAGHARAGHRARGGALLEDRHGGRHCFRSAPTGSPSGR